MRITLYCALSLAAIAATTNAISIEKRAEELPIDFESTSLSQAEAECPGQVAGMSGLMNNAMNGLNMFAMQTQMLNGAGAAGKTPQMSAGLQGSLQQNACLSCQAAMPKPIPKLGMSNCMANSLLTGLGEKGTPSNPAKTPIVGLQSTKMPTSSTKSPAMQTSESQTSQSAGSLTNTADM